MGALLVFQVAACGPRLRGCDKLVAIKRPPPVPAALACVEMTEKVVDHDDPLPSTKQNFGALLLF